MNWKYILNQVFIVFVQFLLIIAFYRLGKFCIFYHISEKNRKVNVLDVIFVLGEVILSAFFVSAIITKAFTELEFYTTFIITIIPALLGMIVEIEKEIKEAKEWKKINQEIENKKNNQ